MKPPEEMRREGLDLNNKFEGAVSTGVYTLLSKREVKGQVSLEAGGMGVPNLALV